MDHVGVFEGEGVGQGCNTIGGSLIQGKKVIPILGVGVTDAPT